MVNAVNSQQKQQKIASSDTTVPPTIPVNNSLDKKGHAVTNDKRDSAFQNLSRAKSSKTIFSNPLSGIF
jgi:hypothetical protein